MTSMECDNKPKKKSRKRPKKKNNKENSAVE